MKKILLLEIVQINRSGQDQKTNENQFLVTPLYQKLLFKRSKKKQRDASSTDYVVRIIKVNNTYGITECQVILFIGVVIIHFHPVIRITVLEVGYQL